MGPFRRIRLFERIFGDTIRLALFGLAVGLGQMVSHQPGSNVFILRFDQGKLALSLAGGLIAAAIVGVIRWRMEARSHQDASD